MDAAVRRTPPCAFEEAPRRPAHPRALVDGKRFGHAQRIGAVAGLQERWDGAVSTALARHVAAHGADLAKPNHFDLWHVADQPAADDIWLGAFVLERKHNLLRPRSEDIGHPATFELSALTAVLSCYLEEAKEARRPRAKLWRTPDLDSAFGHSGRKTAPSLILLRI